MECNVISVRYNVCMYACMYVCMYVCTNLLNAFVQVSRLRCLFSAGSVFICFFVAFQSSPFLRPLPFRWVGRVGTVVCSEAHDHFFRDYQSHRGFGDAFPKMIVSGLPNL